MLSNQGEQVLNAGHAGDACDVTLLVLREYLGLGLVEPQIPHFAEAVELLNGLGHLRFRVSQDQHIIRKREEIPPVDHFQQLRCGSQCFLEVDVEEHG